MEQLSKHQNSLNALESLANHFGTDKGSYWYDCHQYTRVYDVLLAPLRNRPVRLLELGGLHSQDPRWMDCPVQNHGHARAGAAPSMAMWSAYFPKGELWCLDINDFSRVSVDRVRFFRGDAGSRAALGRLCDDAGALFDIVIDDASHRGCDQIIALSSLISRVRDGGLYVIEDLHWQNPAYNDPDGHRLLPVLKKWQAVGIVESPLISAAQAAELSRRVESIHFHDSYGPAQPGGGKDALAILKLKR